MGIRAQAGQPKPQTGHSSLNRTASDQTSKLRPDSLLQDIPIQIGSRQLQSERPGLGLNFLTQPSELRLNSLSSDSPAQSDQHRTDQKCDSRLDHLEQDISPDWTGTAPDQTSKFRLDISVSGPALFQTRRHRPNHLKPDSLRPDIQTQPRRFHT